MNIQKNLLTTEKKYIILTSSIKFKYIAQENGHNSSQLIDILIKKTKENKLKMNRKNTY